jgi:4-amino-4-deoxy-L-arabinose transferase-like glycosyltransferase
MRLLKQLSQTNFIPQLRVAPLNDGRLRGWANQRFTILLGAILGVALSLRVVTLLDLRKSIYGNYLFTDEAAYHTWATQLAEGASLYWCHISPLPAYFMALIYRLFGGNPTYVREANIVLGVLTCFVIFGIGNRIGGTCVGLLSCLMAATYRPFMFLSVTVLKEPLLLFAFSLMVYLFLGELKHHRPIQTLGLGITFGLVAILRPNASVIALIMGTTLFWRYRRTTSSTRQGVLLCLVLLLGALIPSAPFMLKNFSVAGRLTPAPQGGVELYLGYNELHRPYYTPVPFATPSPDEQGIHFRIEASRRLGQTLSFAQASSYWESQVIDRARREPVRFASDVLRKLLAVIHVREENDNHSIEFLKAFVPTLRYPLLQYSVVLPLGLVGLVFGINRYRGVLPLAAAFGAYGLTLALFYCNLRLRAPLLILLIPLAANGIIDLLSARLSSYRARFLFVASTLLLVFLEHVPAISDEDFTGPYNTHASLLIEKGDVSGALEFWKKSQELNGTFSEFATLSMAEFELSRGNAYKAQELAQTVSSVSFAAAFKYDLLGDILTALKRDQEAANAYEKCLSINSARRETRQKLITIYETLNPEKARQHRESLAYIDGFFAQS